MFRDLWSRKEKKGILIGILVFIILVLGYIDGILIQAKHYGDTGVMSFNIFECWKNGFTFEGMGAGIGLVFLIAIGFGAWKMFQKFENGDKDERGFKFSKEGIYGTARWMSDRQLREVYNVTSVNGTKTMILGEKDGRVVSMKKDTRLNPHISVFGASGTMKTRAIVRPSLFQAIRRGESCVITDPKGELYNDTSQLFRENGYEVKVFNLVSPVNSDGWNCMSDLEGDSLLATVLMNVIIGNTSSGRGDHFWDNGEGNLLKAMILYVDLNSDYPPEKKNLGTVYSLIASKTADEIKAMFDMLPDNHPAKVPYNLFAQSADNVKQGIILGLGTRLQVLQNDSVKELITNADIDLTAPGKRKCAYYIILSAQDSTMQFLSSLFFSLFFIKLTRYGDKQPNCKLQVPVNVILDEFCNIGRIGGAADGSDFAKVVSVVRSYGIKIMMIIQSLGQLQNRYPNNLWAELVGNCDTQIMLGCTDDLTAKYISDRSGIVSIDVDSVRLQKKTIAIAQVVPTYSESKGAGKRALLTVDEVLRFPNDELLVFTRGQNALRLKKMDFTRHPISKRMKMVDIYQYYRNTDINVALDPVEEVVEETTAPGSPETGKEYLTVIMKKLKRLTQTKVDTENKNEEKDKFVQAETSNMSMNSIYASVESNSNSNGGFEFSANDLQKKPVMEYKPGSFVYKDDGKYVAAEDGSLVLVTRTIESEAKEKSCNYKEKEFDVEFSETDIDEADYENEYENKDNTSFLEEAEEYEDLDKREPLSAVDKFDIKTNGRKTGYTNKYSSYESNSETTEQQSNEQPQSDAKEKKNSTVKIKKIDF